MTPTTDVLEAAETPEERVHARNLVRFAADRPEVLALSGDLTGSTELALFRDTYPDRFFSLGMAEQNMLSWAGGLAREGFRPFVHTFSVFLVRRPYDQLAMSIAYPHLPVRLIGFLPGVTTPGGVTHQAIEDISLMRGLPNLTVFEVGDAADVESVLELTDDIDGPIYIRMLRGQLPRLFAGPLVFDRARVLRRAAGLKADVTVLSSGVCTAEAMRALAAVTEAGVAVDHLHVTTLKPFTDPTVAEALARADRAVITLENHSINGGLGTAVAELLAAGAGSAPLHKLGLADTFAHGASRDHLMAEYGLDARALVDAVERVVDQPLDIDDGALSGIQLAGPSQPVASDRMEAL